MISIDNDLKNMNKSNNLIVANENKGRDCNYKILKLLKSYGAAPKEQANP